MLLDQLEIAVGYALATALCLLYQPLGMVEREAVEEGKGHMGRSLKPVGRVLHLYYFEKEMVEIYSHLLLPGQREHRVPHYLGAQLAVHIGFGQDVVGKLLAYHKHIHSRTRGNSALAHHHSFEEDNHRRPGHVVVLHIDGNINASVCYKNCAGRICDKRFFRINPITPGVE